MSPEKGKCIYLNFQQLILTETLMIHKKKISGGTFMEKFQSIFIKIHEFHTGQNKKKLCISTSAIKILIQDKKTGLVHTKIFCTTLKSSTNTITIKFKPAVFENGEFDF